ncbi:MAG: DUF4838 domain-containing protein [Candidatus Brocadiia bacterium]
MNESAFLVEKLLMLGVFMISVCGVACAAETVLVRDGQPRAGIVLAEKADDNEKLAAEELKNHIEKISGASLVIDTKPTKGVPTAIYIGAASPDPGKAAIRKGGENGASFRLRIGKKDLHLVGLESVGTLNATYELLERIGVRWCMPGELGTVIPKRKTIAVERGDTIQYPGFQGRHLQAIGDREWSRRMRMGGLDSGGHGLGPRFNRKKEPELFMKQDGRVTGQVNVGKPEVLRRVVDYWMKRLEKNPNIKYLRIGPRDGGGFGEHPWDAGDMDPLHGKVSVTDRYVKFFNQVLERIQKKHPDVGLGFYAYSQYMRPPVREEPNPRILPMLAPIDLCRIHKVDTPHCWERQYMGSIIDGWQKTGVKMMYRGYLFNLCNPGIPYSMGRQVAVEFPFFQKKGIIGCRVETMPAWSFHGPGLYLAAKMMWDPQLDAQAVMKDYYEKLYGPAAEGIRGYFDILENAYLEAHYHTGNVFDVPKILNDEVMKQLDGAIKKAEAAAKGSEIYVRRVEMIRKGFRAGELILATINALNHTDFETAKKSADQARELLKEGRKHEPPLFNKRVGIGYFNRFWANTVDHGYECTHTKGEKVLQLPDEWLFIIDPYSGGVDLGLWKEKVDEQPWHRIRTYSRSWSNQGLRYYMGDSWYRTRFNVPAKYKDRPLMLWLGGVDNDARVWVNGTELKQVKRGASPIGRPWVYDMAQTVRFGSKNTIVIRVRNNRLRELGTGGLTGPAMIYASNKK